MKNMLIISLAVASLSLLIAVPALADESYTCTYGPQERVITIVYLESGQQVPCEVRYEKEGATQTLWSANNEVGYCEEKARAFVEKQRGWGWRCNSTGK